MHHNLRKYPGKVGSDIKLNIQPELTENKWSD